MTKCCFGIKFRYLWTLFKLVRYNMPLFKRNICSKEQLDPSNYFATLQLCVQPTNQPTNQPTTLATPSITIATLVVVVVSGMQLTIA